MTRSKTRRPYCRGLMDRKLGFPLRLTVARRFLRSWTQRELAERAGCSSAVISKLEQGQAKPSIQLLTRLCGALDVSMDWLWARVLIRSNTDQGEDLYREQIRFRDPAAAAQALASAGSEIRTTGEI